MSSARTTSTGASAPAAPFSLTGRLKAGLIVAIILGLGDLVSLLLVPTDNGDAEGDGPPMPILILGTILGAVTLAAIWVAWRSGSRRAIRVVAGTRILSALTSLPAFFVDIPVGLLVFTAIGVLLTIVCLVLILSPTGPKPIQAVTD